MSQIKTAFISSIITTVLISLTIAYFYYDGSDVVTNVLPAAENNQPVSETSVIPAVKAETDYEELDNANDKITSSRRNIITQTVANVSPAVVGINVTEFRYYRDFWSQDPFFRRYFGDRVYKKEVKGLGSGVIISPDGYVLTNDHVAGNASKIIVTMTDGKQYNAEIIGSDEASDICLIKIDAEDLPYVKLGNSDDLIIGEWVIALGNPFGLFAINDQPTVTVGVISATGMNIGAVESRHYLSMIQTDAAINGGNSGGPLVNSLGHLIGLNTLIYSTSNAGGSVGVGFAIPINKVKRISEELKKSGVVERDFWTGLLIQSIDETIAKHYKLPNTRGVILTNILRESPADKSGLDVGDIILKIDKYSISDDASLISILKEYRTGDSINLTILRNNKLINKIMKLEKKDD